MISEDIKKGVTEKIEALKKVKDGKNSDDTKQATEALSLEMQKIGEAMIKNQEAKDKKTKGEDSQKGTIRDADVEEKDSSAQNSEKENKDENEEKNT